MSQIHEILAIIDDKKSLSNKINEETKSTFLKSHLFDGIIKEYNPDSENENVIVEEKRLVSTIVKDKILYTLESFKDYVDIEILKNQSNCKATAHLEIGEQKFELSVSALMDLEKRLTAYLEVCKLIPTLDLGKEWTVDKQQGKEIFKTERTCKVRTKKTIKPITKAKATNVHAEQAELIHIDVKDGMIETVNYSGKWSNEKKSRLLKKIEDIIIEIKKAKSKANQSQTVENERIGSKIIDFIHEDII